MPTWFSLDFSTIYYKRNLNMLNVDDVPLKKEKVHVNGVVFLYMMNIRATSLPFQD